MFDTIIEPFCGAAQYSLYGDNWKKHVILVDKDDKVVRVWKYLMRASKEDILSLPDMFAGDSLNDHKQLSQEERWLIGFGINPGSASPKVTARASGNWSLPQANRASLWNRYKLETAENLYKIKHWEIVHGEYSCLDNITGTWFVDPPYFSGGKYYRMNSSKIDYAVLGDWCKSRNGQVMVCENDKATWLDFKPLVEMHGQLHKTMEVIWTKES